MKIANTERIRLDEPARAALTQMIAILSGEGEHLSLSPSRVVSLILCEYSVRYFTKDRARLIEGLLDKRALLKAMLKQVRSGSDEEIESLRVKLATLTPKRSMPLATRKPASTASSEALAEGTS